MGGVGTYISLIFSVIGIIVVLALLFMGSKWVTRKYSSVSGSRHIKVLDRVMVGQDKSIVLADIAGNKYVIGVSGQQITLLKDIGEIQLPEIAEAPQDDFYAIFSDLLKKQAEGVKKQAAAVKSRMADFTEKYKFKGRNL